MLELSCTCAAHLLTECVATLSPLPHVFFKFGLSMASVDRCTRWELLLFKYHVGFHPQLDSSITVHQIVSIPLRRSARGGYHATLQYTLQSPKPVPIWLTSNMSTLFMNIFNLLPVLQSMIHDHTSLVCIQKSWLDPNVTDSLTLISDFKLYRQESFQCRDDWRKCGNIYQVLLV